MIVGSVISLALAACVISINGLGPVRARMDDHRSDGIILTQVDGWRFLASGWGVSVMTQTPDEVWRCDALALERNAAAVVEAAIRRLVTLGEISPSGAEWVRSHAQESLRSALIALYVHRASPPDQERVAGLVRAAVFIAALEGQPMPNTDAEVTQLQSLVDACAGVTEETTVVSRLLASL
jgi:hypothetical protein